MSFQYIIQAILFSILLIIISVIDVRNREIPPIYCVAVALCSVLDFKVANLLGLGIALILWVCAAFICPNMLGGGDIKLTAAVSLVLGFTATAYGIIIGFTLELICFSVIKHQKKLSEQEAKNYSMPLAPFLSIGFLTTYFINLGGLSI
ncbi:prepilin peptidase [Anaerotignum sp. MB30-C6]|uniref:prepilin peptidase n=1 Tax=Anaerotignum sp. MB30-C6 TaxID=3070814 RepID=UPI0027DAC9BC|nr:prepilin peptidase [Anaerotignum sp. MB30-C6]WMI82410.1 prepilin peptidase [Anaerotignum sp. MB30-C6]